MGVDGADLLQRLLVIFQGEAEDHLRALNSLLEALGQEEDPAARKPLLESLSRRMHTLKGAAHAVNLLDVAEVCQVLESILADVKRGDMEFSAPLLDRLQREVQGLEQGIFPGPPGAFGAPGMAAAPVEDPIVPPAEAPEAAPSTFLPAAKPPASEPPASEPVSPPPVEPIASRATPVEPPLPAGQPQPVRSAPVETVRVPVPLLEQLLLQAEELVSAKLMVSSLVEGLGELSRNIALRADQRARAEALARSGPAEGTPAALAQLIREQLERESRLGQRLQSLTQKGQASLWALGGMVDTLLGDVKELQLLPFTSVVESFPRLVRELCAELGKEADLHLRGGELEVDRRILAELKEPLLHLVRNILDHGIEPPAERRERGKPARGRVTIALRHLDGNRAEIEVTDDGAGIDPARVKGAALRQELITEAEAAALSDAEALNLIFESGLSTSSMITSISGRGLGCAIVRESLEKLGGHAAVVSQIGTGTVFRLVLPLNFAMMDALLVEVSGRQALIPSSSVRLTCRVSAAEVKGVENRETVTVEGEVLSLARLARILELPEPEDDPPLHQVVVLDAAERRIALAVDAIFGVQEILAKPLGPQLSRVRNVAGATVLGNGQVVPILNVNDLFRSALTAAQAKAQPLSGRGKARQLSVLVAEDSITSRTLLKNILEGAGFAVRTAVDGSDALALVKSEEFDIVVSDVEMPRMDGFQLTAAIRGDQRLAELPVILVTGLESREDRERGIDVGANAYLVKSSFDQGGLVEVIRKLS
ncbi:hybrid sensor histidine kinase/response regulator [Geomesophilobacter sediminis]|uniref:histidine kinase n=1 Tax=Geomesophilobacter sediminis TaxID=2798584 RepID=A0A8J7J3E8_9BACT|nr:response regulator [Geomesophilobacter sediminis]MBJ6725308.1 response regulator [Geomesophilobacter sediminis]